MSEHTPGPWQANCFMVTQAGKQRLEICHTGIVGRNKPGKQAEADAKLIAAAPDLLEFAKQVLDYATDTECFYLMSLAQSVVDKVEGKP